MKKSLLILALVLCSCLTAFSQATSLTVDCQNPGWLSNMINYGDQQTLENLTVTGYLNGTDIKFIRGLNLNRSLSGVIDLEDANIVSGGETYGPIYTCWGYYNPVTEDNYISDHMFAHLKPIRKVMLPKSITNISGYYLFTGTSVDTLIINGDIKSISIGGAYDNFEWNCRCVYFPTCLENIDFGRMTSNIEYYLPDSLKTVGSRDYCYVSNGVFHCSSFTPETISVGDFIPTSSHSKFFEGGTIYVPKGTKEKYEHSIFSNLTIIEDIPVESISLIENKSLYVGDQTQLQAQIQPTNALNQAVIWKSSNTDVATISKDGLLTAISYGTADIMVTTVDGGFTAICRVNVYEHTTGVQMVNNVSLSIGKQYELNAQTLPLSTSDGKITYSSNNTSIATVDNNGVVHGKTKGSCTITATSVDGGHTATCAVTVTQPVEALVLEKHSVTLSVGGTDYLYAQIYPATADNKAVVWSSSREPSVTVDASGNITAIKGGIAWIKAVSVDNPEAKDSCRVAVTPIVFTLTYIVDGEVYKSYDIEPGAAITPEEEPTKEGYTFSGWSEIPETMPAENVVVTGTFTVNGYTLTYIVDGEEYKTASVAYGTTITPEAEPTKEGYTFSGWNGLPETMPAENVTVTGSFTINQYLLTYIIDGEEYKSYTVDYNTTLTPETAPTKKGMTFSGWGDVPATMPAHNVTLSGTYSWSEEIVDGITYQVTDTLSNYASVIGAEGEEVTILSDVEIGGYIYTVSSIADGALPKTSTITISVGKLLLWLWNNGYENIYETGTGRNLAAPEIELVNATASSLALWYRDEYPQLSETVTVAGSPVEKEGKEYSIALMGLEPGNLYEELATLTLTLDDATYTKSFSFSTEPLTLVTQQARVVSLGNVVVAATSNLDDEETNVGFEWRRTDWPDDFNSNSGVAYLFEGTMEGYIRNLNTDKLWRSRPFYESNAGNRYYGDWVGIDPTDISYFDPTVHTYPTINVIGNTAEVKGYAMRGTDNLTSQGFVYWSISGPSSRRQANGVPYDAAKVLGTGNVMTATLEGLEYDTEYCYMAFVTTSEGETFYGESQTFKTYYDPDGIEDIELSTLNIEESWYSLDGKKLAKPQKGINIIRYSDGTTRKVLIK